MEAQLCDLTAIHVDDLPGDEIRFAGGQKSDQISHVFGKTNSPPGD